MKSSRELLKVNQFCDFVNDNHLYLIRMSFNNNSINYWSRSCSAMDWLKISTDHIRNITKRRIMELSDLEFFSLITAITLVMDCIGLLHKTFIDSKTQPFKGEQRIFAHRQFDLDDTDYFKKIRAIFGAHPVDIQIKGKTSKLWYASWPSDGNSQSHQKRVYLYGENISDKYIEFGISITELFEFYNTRFAYISVIKKSIKSKIIEYKTYLVRTPIRRVSDPLEQISILDEENKKRFDRDDYGYYLSLCRLFFETEFDHLEDADWLRKRILSGINEIFKNLQGMYFRKLYFSDYVDLDTYTSNQIGHCFSKLREKIFGCPGCHVAYHEPLIAYIDGYVSGKYSSDRELYWLVIIAMNKRRKEKAIR